MKRIARPPDSGNAHVVDYLLMRAEQDRDLELMLTEHVHAAPTPADVRRRAGRAHRHWNAITIRLLAALREAADHGDDPFSGQERDLMPRLTSLRADFLRLADYGEPKPEDIGLSSWSEGRPGEWQAALKRDLVCRARLPRSEARRRADGLAAKLLRADRRRLLATK